MDASVRCPRCWKHVPSGARFCPRCGSALIPDMRPIAPPPPRLAPQSGGGGGLTALLIFLVIGAFGLMVVLFVTSSPPIPAQLSPSPVLVEPNSLRPPAPDGVGASDDRPSAPQYAPGPRYYQGPPVYEARPRAVPYPPAPDPFPWSHDRDRDSHR